MRKPVAMFIMLFYLAVYIWFVSLAATAIGDAHSLIQLGFYVVAGFIWIIPLKPLFAWMNVGTPPPE